jgi:hypothetical protein
MRSFFLVCIAALSLAVAGCAGTATQTGVPNLPQAMPVDPPGGSYMLTVNTFAGDALHEMLLLRMGSGGGILTTSLVNLHNFEQTSAFGRVASQQIGSRLGQYGFRVIEARLASTLSMTPRTGEFMLTRETARLLADTHDAGAVLVGSYSDEGSNVFVSVRIVRLSDNAILGAYEYYLPRDDDVRSLLGSGKRGGSGSGSAWARHNARTPAFGPDRNVDQTKTAPTGQATAPKVAPQKAPQADPKAAPAKRAVTSQAAPPASQAAIAPAVPRYVDPNASSVASEKAATPAAPVVPAEPKAKPVPLQKDLEAAPNTPGGM